MIAHAAGLTAPIAVSTAVTANITHGMSATRPPTACTAHWTIRSTVPLFSRDREQVGDPDQRQDQVPADAGLFEVEQVDAYRRIMANPVGHRELAAPVAQLLIESGRPMEASALVDRLVRHDERRHNSTRLANALVLQADGFRRGPIRSRP